MPKKSDVWQHFTRDTDGHGNVINKARCNYCTDRKEFQTKDGTANLWKHFKKFHPQEAAAAEVVGQGSTDAGTSEKPPQGLPSLAQDDEALQQLPPLLPVPVPLPACAPSLHGGSSDRESSSLQEEASKDLARMIALRGHDASVLEDDYFKSFVRRLHPEFEVPSRVTIEEMCDAIFDEERTDLLSRLKNAPARVSVAVGKAKTIEAGEVIYTACHFIDDEWNLRKLVLQAPLVHEQFEAYENDRILGVHVVFPELDYFYDEVLGIIFDHGIQDRLSMVAYDDYFHPNDVKDYIEEKINAHTIFVDSVLHKIAGCLLPCSDLAFDKIVVTKDLNLTRQTRQQLLSHCGLDNPWTYNEIWYSCYCSKVILHKNGVDIDSLLCKVWGAIHQAIQRIFASTSNICLREFFNVREVLQSELVREVLLSELASYVWLEKASNTLDKAIQDSYLIWSVPFVLDPRYKRELLEFCFERAFGLEEAAKYVSEVMTRINELYDYYIKQYERSTGAGHSNNAMIATTSADPLQQAWNEHRRRQDIIMVDQVNSTYPETQTELHRYLHDPLVPSTQDFDILDWWKAHSSKYPTVALMARDALAWPTCSKLSSDQIAQVRSIVRGYSKQRYRDIHYWLQDDTEEEEE